MMTTAEISLFHRAKLSSLYPSRGVAIPTPFLDLFPPFFRIPFTGAFGEDSVTAEPTAAIAVVGLPSSLELSLHPVSSFDVMDVLFIS